MGNDEQPNPEDLAPMLAAADWLNALEADEDEFWFGLDRTFRLVLVQLWLRANPDAASGSDRDHLAADLVNGEPASLFVHCRRVSRRTLMTSLEPFLGGWSLGTRPRPIGPDMEAVRLFLTSEVDDGVFKVNQVASSCALLLRWSHDRWMVASTNGAIAHPGWPPTFETLDTNVID